MKSILPLPLIVLFLTFVGSPRGFGQCLPSEQCGEINCLFGPVLLAGETWTNDGFTGNPAPNFCGTLESDLWFPVMADSTGTIDITLFSSNCVSGNGMQLALYAHCDSVPVACNGGLAGGGSIPLTLTSPSVPGQLYYLLVDGFAGDICDFTLEVSGLVEVSGVSLLTGEVLIDTNLDCIADASDLPAQQVRVVASGGINGARFTDVQGRFRFNYPESGSSSFSVTLGNLDNDLWDWCPDSYTITPSGVPDTAHIAFLLQPLSYCTDMRVELTLPPFFRPCEPVAANVSYSNHGTLTAENAELRIVIDPVLNIDSATMSFAQTGDTLIFALGDVTPLGVGNLRIWLKPLCDGGLMGRTLCMEAHIYPDTPCGLPPGWSGAHVAIEAGCADSLVQFRLKNTGTAPMTQMQEYIIVEDEVVLRSGNFQLNAGAEMLVTAPANGATWRMEAGQEPGHPGFSQPALSIEGCGGLTSGLVNAFPLDDADLFKDIECRVVIAAYDPNIKTASPAGVGSSQSIRPNTPLEYTIHFQNTGTDTAFYVRVVDVLPPTLDPASLRPGASSHPCTWRILGLDTLEVVFDPIILPDSNVNEPASKGWFDFRINQRPDLPNGTQLQNSAAIYFDYNAPIITDPAWHTVSQLSVQIDDPSGPVAMNWRVLGNPLSDRCTFLAQHTPSGATRFELYDQQGRLLRVETFWGERFVLGSEGLPSGAYFFRLIPEQGGIFSGKLVVSHR